MKHWENHSFLKVNSSLIIHLSKLSLFSFSSSSRYSSTSLSPSSSFGGWLSCDPHLSQLTMLLIMTLTSLSSDLLLFRAGITGLCHYALLMGSVDQTQGCMHVLQTLCQLSYIPDWFFLNMGPLRIAIEGVCLLSVLEPVHLMQPLVCISDFRCRVLRSLWL